MEGLFTCNVDNLPTELFVHNFWSLFSLNYQNGMQEYNNCIQVKNASAHMCRLTTLNSTCPRVLGSDWEASYACAKSLHDNHATEPFTQYRNCMSNLRSIIGDCIRLLKIRCSQSELRVMKTVRTSLASVKILLRMLPYLKVIHLMRDPRAVVLSRMANPTFRGHASHRSPVLESEFLCRDISKDLIIKRELEYQYPDNFMEVIYDDFVLDPVGSSQRIYKFIGRSISDSVLRFIQQNAGNSSGRASHWQTKMNYQTAIKIRQNCQSFYKTIKFDWI